MAKDPNAVAQKWATAMQSSGQAIKDGVQAVTIAPGQAAARQKSVYVNNVAANADKWARNVQSVTLSEWQDAMINKGAARVGSGATAALPKMQNAMAQLLPKIDSIVSGLPPRGDLGANIARMTTFVQQMAQVQITK